jgi:hypothetical protein
MPGELHQASRLFPVFGGMPSANFSGDGVLEAAAERTK